MIRSNTELNQLMPQLFSSVDVFPHCLLREVPLLSDAPIFAKATHFHIIPLSLYKLNIFLFITFIINGLTLIPCKLECKDYDKYFMIVEFGVQSISYLNILNVNLNLVEPG